MWSRRAVLLSGSALAALVLLPGRALAATDQLRLGLAHEPPHLDPVAGQDAATLAVSYQNLFEGLTRIDAHNQVQPGLAKAWTPAPDKLSHTFSLVEDVRYHDGTAFEAGHVVYALKRLIASTSSSPDRARYAGIADVVAIDDLTAKIVLSKPDDDLLYKLGLPAASIVAPESADNNKLVPIGTGPFAFLEWDPRQQIILQRNEDYWGPHPRINQATFTSIADPGAAAAALTGNAIDGFPDFPAPDALVPLRANPAFNIITGKGPDGTQRVGAWKAKLAGMWADAPVESCVLAGIYWNEPGGAGPPDSTPPPRSDQAPVEESD